MLLDDDIGRRGGPGGIGKQVHRPCQRHGEEPLAAAMEHAVDDLGLRAGSGEKDHASAGSSKGLERRDFRQVESFHSEQPDAVNRRQIEGRKAPRWLDPRPQARGGARTWGQCRGHVEGISSAAAAGWITVDQQHIDAINHIDRHRPCIVGGHCIGGDRRLDEVRARLREADIKPLRPHAASGDFRDPHTRPAQSILAEFDGHVANRSVGVVADRHLQRHEHAGGGHAPGHLEPLHRQVARLTAIAPFGGAVHQPHFTAGVGQLPQQACRFVGGLPVLEAKIADQPDHVGRPGAAAEHSGSGSHCPPRAGRRRGWRPSGQIVADLLHQPWRHRLQADVECLLGRLGLASRSRRPINGS